MNDTKFTYSSQHTLPFSCLIASLQIVPFDIKAAGHPSFIQPHSEKKLSGSYPHTWLASMLAEVLGVYTITLDRQSLSGEVFVQMCSFTHMFELKLSWIAHTALLLVWSYGWRSPYSDSLMSDVCYLFGFMAGEVFAHIHSVSCLPSWEV